MKHLTLFAAAVVFFTTGLAFGQSEPGPNYEHLKAMEWVIGEWAMEMELPENTPNVGEAGDRIQVDVTYKWGLNKNVVVSHLIVRAGDTVLNKVVSTAGWDAEKQKIVLYGFHLDGGRNDGLLTITSPSSYKMNFRAVSKDGEPEEATLYAKRIDGNTLSLQMNDEPPGNTNGSMSRVVPPTY